MKKQLLSKSSQDAFTRVEKLIATHLPATGCSTITQRCFLDGFDDKKQKRKAQVFGIIGEYDRQVNHRNE
jgi:hypothetical protein